MGVPRRFRGGDVPVPQQHRRNSRRPRGARQRSAGSLMSARPLQPRPATLSRPVSTRPPLPCSRKLARYSPPLSTGTSLQAVPGKPNTSSETIRLVPVRWGPLHRSSTSLSYSCAPLRRRQSPGRTSTDRRNRAGTKAGKSLRITAAALACCRPCQIRATPYGPGIRGRACARGRGRRS
jgi:hypothetical protein